MKKIIWYILLLVLCNLIFCSCTVTNMHEKYVIPSNLIKLDGETLVSLDLASGEKNTFQIGEYDFDINGTSVISDGNSIYLFDGGTWNRLPIDGYKIHNKPVIADDSVFFVSPDPEDLSTFPKLFIWKYEKGDITKFSENPVWYGSNILAFENNLIFVRNSDLSIVCKNLGSGAENHLGYGSCLCWKEKGKSFYFQAYAEGLALYDIASKEISVIDKKIDLHSSPIYDEEKNILIITCDDPRNYSSVSYSVAGLYFLNDNKLIYCDDYFKYVGINSDILNIESFEPSIKFIYLT